jgi:hypothetical protein
MEESGEQLEEMIPNTSIDHVGNDCLLHVCIRPIIVYNKIFNLVNPQDIINVAKVCTRWRELARNKEIWNREMMEPILW